MDAIPLIVTALVSGAAAAVEQVAGQAVADAYTGLKALIIKRYGSQGDVAEAVGKVEQKPASFTLSGPRACPSATGRRASGLAARPAPTTWTIGGPGWSAC